MTNEPLSSGEDPDEEVDVDLDATSDSLRAESVGRPTTVRIDGIVIHIEHAGDWTSSAMRAASFGNWEDWAREVIDDDEEFRAWQDADLKNFQVEAVFNEAARKARMSQGKSKKQSGSHHGSQRRLRPT